MGSTAVKTRGRIKPRSMRQFAIMGIRRLTATHLTRRAKNLAMETAARVRNKVNEINFVYPPLRKTHRIKPESYQKWES